MSTFSTVYFAFKEYLSRYFFRFTQPDLSASYDTEVTQNFFNDGPLRDELPNYVIVEDNHSPVTIICFASSALLFAGQPTFEFRGFLKSREKEFNLVFLREVHRMGFHLTPDGKTGGTEFYENEIKRILEDLGSEITITIGDSSGGAAALYYATRLELDKAICLSPVFPLRNWISPSSAIRTFTDFRQLRKSPYTYWESCIITFTTFLVYLTLVRTVGREGIWDPPATYRAAMNRPKATIFYGEECHPDVLTAKLIGVCPEAKLVPIATGRHCSTMGLARTGDLRKIITDEIDDGIPSGVTTKR